MKCVKHPFLLSRQTMMITAASRVSGSAGSVTRPTSIAAGYVTSIRLTQPPSPQSLPPPGQPAMMSSSRRCLSGVTGPGKRLVSFRTLGHDRSTDNYVTEKLVSELKLKCEGDIVLEVEVVGAQGDVKKMYYNVRVTKEEEFMQLFLWKFEGENKIRTFAMTRLVMGNKPSANASQIALRETGYINNNQEKFPAAARALTSNSYVDNTFVGNEDHKSVEDDIKAVERVAMPGQRFSLEIHLSISRPFF